MITAMLTFITVIFVYLSICYELIPIWLRIIMYGLIFICELIAYGSEDNLRNKVKSLEDEMKNLKKGGE